MSKYPAFGIQIAWDPAGGSSYATIGQILDVAGPNLQRSTIDVTTHDSVDAWMEFLKSLKDGGEVTFSIVWDPALGTHDAATGLASDFDEDSINPNFQITFPDTGNTVWTFPGAVTNFNPTAPVADRLSADVTIKVMGKPTLA